jgi:hypothetical protein
MALVRLETIKVTTAGVGPGVATGSGRAGVPGGIVRLIALAVDYDPTCPGTTDVVITCTLPVPKTLLTLTNNNADFPLAQITEVEKDTVGADRATPATKPQLVCGELVVNVAGCDVIADAVIVTALVEVRRG